MTTVPEKESDDENELGLLSGGADGWFDDDGGMMTKAHPNMSSPRPSMTRRLSQASKSFKISAPSMKGFKLPKLPKRGGNGFHGDSLM